MGTRHHSQNKASQSRRPSAGGTAVRRREDFGELVEVPPNGLSADIAELALPARPLSALPSREEVIKTVGSIPERHARDYGGKCASFCLALKSQLPAHFEAFLCGSVEENRMHTYLLIGSREGFVYVDPSIRQYLPEHAVTFIGTKSELKRLICDPRTVLHKERCGTDREKFFRRAYGEAALDYYTDRVIPVED